MQFVYDTGSSWLTVPLGECSTCTGHKHYDYKASGDEEGKAFALNYGSASLNCLLIKDFVCIQDRKCSLFDFCGITKQTGIQGFDGILGLSPEDARAGPLLIKSLYDSGVIEKKEFAFYLSHK